MTKVRISESAHKYIDLHRGTKTQGDFIDTLVQRDQRYATMKKKLHETELENERLRSEKPLEAENSFLSSAKHTESTISPTQPLEAQDINCPALVYHEGKFFCFKNAPKATELKSLDFCRAHLQFYNIVAKLTKDYTYTTCGGEQLQGKDGFLWLKCPLDHGSLHRWEDCKKVGCRHIKTVKAEKK